MSSSLILSSFSSPFSSVCQCRLVSRTGIITTIAGTGTAGSLGDNGAALSAQINYPQGIETDNSGNVFIADSNNYKVRKISSSGTITTYAGTGTSGSNGDNGAAISAQMTLPYGVALDHSGNLFIADLYNNKLRKVNMAGIITTYAGTGISGSSGDGGLAINCQLPMVIGVAVDISSNVYILSGDSKIRVVSSTGIITTFAGTGIAGNLGDGGLAVNAQLNSLQGIDVDKSGNVYVADTGNNKIRLIIYGTGIITTVVNIGGSYTGPLGDNGPATNAVLFSPSDVSLDKYGNLYIADRNNYLVRKISSTLNIPTAPPTSSPSYMTDQTLANANLNFENVVSTSDYYKSFPVGSVMNGWTTGGNYVTDQSGGVGIISTSNGIGFASPFPNNLQYACWFQNLNNGAIVSVSRSLTGLVVGTMYFVSFWTTCRSGINCPTTQSFNVLLDGVTVYSTPPSSNSWLLCSSLAKVATTTSMNLMFRQSSTASYDTEMAMDAITLQNIPFFTYMGCFVDQSYTTTGIRALPMFLYTSISSYQACVRYAVLLGYRYVGFQWWNGPGSGFGSCFGGNSLTNAENQGTSTNCAFAQTTDGSVMWGGGNTNAVYDLSDGSYDFENIVSTNNFYKNNPIGSVIGGWTTGGNYVTDQSGGVGIISYQNSIGFASPFPNNLQYACWFQNSISAISSITRTISGVVVGNAYYVSFWTTCRAGYSCPPPRSFTAFMDGVTVYSTSPSSNSWVLVRSGTYIAIHTSITLMFQLNNLEGVATDFEMGLDAITLQHANPSPLFTYVGCFTDFVNQIHTLPTILYTDLTGYQTCFDQAMLLGYRYVGFQWWNGPAFGVGYCLAGNSLVSVESQGTSTNCAIVQTTDGSITWGGSGANAVYDLSVGSFDFENIGTAVPWVQVALGTTIGGGWTTGGSYVDPNWGYLSAVSVQWGGFPSPFPNNHQYAFWFNSYNAITSVSRTMTGLVVGNVYFVSFWTSLRYGYSVPSQSFSVLLDGVTVYSTSPGAEVWVLVSTSTKTAIDTSMNLMFQMSVSGMANMAIDAVALQHKIPLQIAWQPKQKVRTYVLHTLC